MQEVRHHPPPTLLFRVFSTFTLPLVLYTFLAPCLYPVLLFCIQILHSSDSKDLFSVSFFVYPLYLPFPWSLHTSYNLIYFFFKLPCPPPCHYSSFPFHLIPWSHPVQSCFLYLQVYRFPDLNRLLTLFTCTCLSTIPVPIKTIRQDDQDKVLSLFIQTLILPSDRFTFPAVFKYCCNMECCWSEC